MAFTPRLGNFQAPPPVVPQGLATRAPSAMARATGTGMTTNQGEKIPGLQGRGAGRDTGLGSLVSDMTQEIDNTSTPDELNYTMAQAGTELRKQLTGESEAEILAGQDNRTFLAQAMDAGALAPAQSRVNAAAQAKVQELNNNFPDEFFADGPIIFKMVGEEGRVQEVGSITPDGEFVPVDQIQADAAQMKTDALEALEPDEKVIDPLIDAYAKELTATMAAPTLTTEAANKRAKQVLGIDEKEDVPDWAMPLFAFGMALMSETGPFGQAVGKAGLKTLPVIAQVKKEKKAERRETGKIAYNLMTADAATRSKAVDRSMNYLWKKKTYDQAERKFKADQKQALFDGIYKWIGSLPKRAAAVASGQMAEVIASQFMNGNDLSKTSLNDMETAAGAFITKTTSEMHKTNPLAWAEMQGYEVIENKDWAARKLIDDKGVEKTYRVNTVAGNLPVYDKKGQPIYNDDGTPKIKFYNAFELRQSLDRAGRVVSGGPADAGWQLALFGGAGDKMYQKLVNTNDYTTPERYETVDGTVYLAGSVVPAGKYVRDTGDPGRKRSQVGSLYTLNKHGQPIAITGSSEDIKKGLQAAYSVEQLQEFQDLKNEVLQSVRLAKSIINLVDANPRATAITGGLTGDAIKLAQKFDVWLGGWTGKDFKAFERSIGSLGIFKNVDVDAGGKVANNASSLFGLSKIIDRDYVDSIKNTKFGSAKKGSVERELTDDEFNALQGLAALDIGMRARLWKMAYAVARVSEPGGRLTDRDFANALAQMGVDANGNYDPASLKAVLSDLAAEAQQGVADKGNTIDSKARMTVESIYGPKGSYPNAPIFKGGNLEKLITPKAGQPSGGQPGDTSALKDTFPLIADKTAVVNGITTPLFTPEGNPNSEAVAERRRMVQQSLNEQTLTSDERAALTAEIQRLNALTGIILER